MLTKRWSVLVDNQPHDVVVSWNVTSTGGGMIVVDGVEQSRWLVGVKWPGVEKRLVVGGRRARAVQHTFGDFGLEVEGASVSAPVQIPPSEAARRLGWLGLVVLVGPVVGVVVLAGVLAAAWAVLR